MKDLLEPYLTAILGTDGKRMRAWMKVWKSGSGCAFVGASKDSSFMCNAEETHVLLIGDLIVLPDLAIASNHLRGYGAAGLLTDDGNDLWLENGRVIVKPRGGING